MQCKVKVEAKQKVYDGFGLGSKEGETDLKWKYIDRSQKWDGKMEKVFDA